MSASNFSSELIECMSAMASMELDYINKGTSESTPEITQVVYKARDADFDYEITVTKTPIKKGVMEA